MEHPGFMDHHNAAPNPYEQHIIGRPPFYNRDDPVLPDFLEDGDPIIVTRDGDVRFYATAETERASSSDAVPTPEVTYTYASAGLPVHYVPDLTEVMYMRERESLISGAGDSADAFYPFESEKDFEFVRRNVRNGVPQTEVDDLLKLSPSKCPLKEDLQQSLKSSYNIKKLIKEMDDGLGFSSWMGAEMEIAQNVNHREPIKFWYRDPIDTAKWLLRQVYNSQNSAFSPERSFADGVRQYGEMHTGDWWWKEQDKLPAGAALVPIMLLSDSTHLTSYVGDKKIWPVYMTIGNLSSTVRMKPKSHSVVMIALLPEKFKHSEQIGITKTAQASWDHQIIHEVLKVVLQPLFDHSRNVDPNDLSPSPYFHALCGDGYWRQCFPRVAAWLADYPEHMALQSLTANSCPWCEVPYSKLGEFPSQYPRRNHLEYMRLFHNNGPRRDGLLTARGVRTTTDNVLWRLRCDPTELPKPDLLHTMQVGMLKHLLGWIMGFLKLHRRLALFNSLWMAVPSYLTWTKPNKTFEETTQWNGEEYKKMSRFLVGCLANSLRRPSNSQERVLFERAVLCARGLCEFYMYCRYPIHDAFSLDSMEESLRCFHDNKGVFLEQRAGKRIRSLVKATKTNSVKARDLESKKARPSDRKAIAASYNRAYNCEKAQIHRMHAHFNFPKIHLTSHFRESIELFGTLDQHSTSTTELLHKTQVKAGYRGSNKCGDFFTQILQFNARREAFEVRALNLHHQSCDTTTMSIPHERPPHVLKGPSNLRTYVFGAFLASITSPQLRNDLESATRRYLNDEDITIEDEELDLVPVVVYKSISVHVLKYGTAIWVKQILRCTMEALWHKKAPRNDWVWWRACQQSRVMSKQPSASSVPPLPWKALRGRLPVRLISVFKLSAMKDGMLLPDLQLAFVQPTNVATGGVVERVSGMVKVVRPTPEMKYRVIHVSQIDGAAHLIPFDPDCNTNREWLVNSHIDIETWNEVAMDEVPSDEDPMDVDSVTEEMGTDSSVTPEPEPPSDFDTRCDDDMEMSWP